MKEYIKTSELIEWLKGKKYIYYNDNLKDFIEYGSPDDYENEDFTNYINGNIVEIA